MNEKREFLRSPELMSSQDTAVLVVDMQERLLPVIAGKTRVVWNVRRLIDGARILGLPIISTEQYPAGLGKTAPELAERLGTAAPSKLSFSCCACPEAFAPLEHAGVQVQKLLVCGVEAHVCVQQTVMDLLASNWRVYVAVDAVGSRFAIDYETALRRMDSAGATLTTTEAALFEWCQAADTPQFKQISQLAREPEPAT